MCGLNAHILNQADPFEFVYECLSGTHGLGLIEHVEELYSQVVMDYGYHPDDDFEKIIEQMIMQMEDEG